MMTKLQSTLGMSAHSCSLKTGPPKVTSDEYQVGLSVASLPFQWTGS